MIKYCNKTPLYLGGTVSVHMCLGAQYDHLIETVLLSTNRIFLLRNKTNNYGLNIIKGSGLLCGNGGPQTALRIVINLP